MQSDRRNFIKFVVAGSVAAGCPVDLSLLAAPDPTPAVDGEHNEICHQVRDGHIFSRPPASARHDIVIVGGGMSGLSAAWFLRDQDFLLLEKEDHWGGNAYLEEYAGQAFATGTAYTSKKETGVIAVCKELGIEPLPIACPDGLILNREFVPHAWREGLDHLPYPQNVRDSFRKFKQDMLKVDLMKRVRGTGRHAAHRASERLRARTEGLVGQLRALELGRAGRGYFGAGRAWATSRISPRMSPTSASPLPADWAPSAANSRNACMRATPDHMLAGATISRRGARQARCDGDVCARGAVEGRDGEGRDHGHAEVHYAPAGGGFAARRSRTPCTRCAMRPIRWSMSFSISRSSTADMTPGVRETPSQT